MPTFNVSYHDVSDISTSWEKLRRVSGYSATAGRLILEHAAEINPRIHRRIVPGSKQGFDRQAAIAMETLELFVDCLGPELESWMDDFARQGDDSVGAAQYLPALCEAVVPMLDSMLQDKFTDEERYAWLSVARSIEKFLAKRTARAEAGSRQRLEL